MSEVLTLGEAMAVFASSDIDEPLWKAKHFDKYLAGAEVNVTIGLSRLEHSIEFITQLGDDPIGEFIQYELKKSNIDIKNISINRLYQTGIMMKQRVLHGDPDTASLRKNSAASHLNIEKTATLLLDQPEVIYFTGVFLALSEQTRKSSKWLIEKYKNVPDIKTVFDTNLRPNLWESTSEMIKTVNYFAHMAKIVLPGLDEGKILTGNREPNDIADFYLNNSDITEIVVIKLGVNGAFLKDKYGHKMTIPGFKVDKILDTVGAGDGFAVGLISGLLEGLSIESAIVRGNAIGAMAVQSYGDNDGYPTMLELNQFLVQHDQI
ncbi:sugar kinase [Weissella koreensis]|uniref:Sugar kinase n=1 Tax=Weissella koreensis TaxID=165096 RepID=A0A7H1MMA0_9LACO|nr:sugar kinase [Weissella koreensis]AVH75381.1 sugar kinase [Weissella koreensis]EJF34885.1 hypothetical protein JC2156_11970 [Weissella koreensis KCTC 3621]MCZ9311232.1 sugar kinase [Weissella koreensis]QGN20607.1 sugar kinase [Weissella koreensis]QNT64586.1 sugar kinase [Weissella koreensis]